MAAWRNPIGVRRIIIALAVTASVAAVPWIRPDPVKLELYISPDAWNGDEARLASQAIAEFNETHPVSMGDRVVEVMPQPKPSGQAEADLIGSGAPVHVWIPASRLWGDLLNEELPGEWAGSDAQTLVQSPQVIAMWAEDAHRIDPDRSGSVGWRDLVRFATTRMAWAKAVGRAGEGFRFVHTNPGVSTSGLSAAISEFAAAAKTSPSVLRTDDIEPNRVTVHQVELSIVHYGDIVADLMKQMACYGDTYASAIYVQEQSILDFNEGTFDGDAACARHEAHQDLVPVGPSDGTLVADYPCYALHRPDVAQEIQDAAARFCGWLADWFGQHPDVVSRFHFHPSTAEIEGTVNRPDPGTSRAVQIAWKEERKPASVVVGIDRSDSMRVLNMRALPGDINACIGSMNDDDRVGMLRTTSSDPPIPVAALGSEQRQVLREATEKLELENDNALWDWIHQSVEMVRTDHFEADRINATVILTDGTDTRDRSEIETDRLRRYLEKMGRPVRVFVVFYGSGPVDDTLREIVGASQGRVVPSDAADGDICQAVFDYF